MPAPVQYADFEQLFVAYNRMRSLSTEHWDAARGLFAAGMLPSALVVHRAQFEALVRSIWTLYAATDEEPAISERQALNSYTHAGIHPVRRHEDGYPVELLVSALRNANGLGVFSGMQMAVLSGIQPLQRQLLDLAARYPRCMPPLLDARAS